MFPVNQVILGGGDPLLSTTSIGSNIEEQIQLLEKQKQLLENAKQQRMQQMTQPQVQQPPQKLIWDEIDSERGEFFEEDFKDMRDPYEMYEDFYFNRHSPKGEFIEQMKYMDHEDKKRLMEMMLEGNEDVYVAINAQYHDYCELFKAWFGDNIDTKIIESAINFWFKDDDYKGGCKIWKYFKEA